MKSGDHNGRLRGENERRRARGRTPAVRVVFQPLVDWSRSCEAMWISSSSLPPLELLASRHCQQTPGSGRSRSVLATRPGDNGGPRGRRAGNNDAEEAAGGSSATMSFNIPKRDEKMKKKNSELSVSNKTIYSTSAFLQPRGNVLKKKQTKLPMCEISNLTDGLM